MIEGAWQASCPGDIEAAVERIIAAIQEAEVRLRSILGSIGAIKGTTVLSERRYGWPPVGRVLKPVWFTSGLRMSWASGSISRKAGSISIEEMFASAHVGG